jgi:hypothetical protein
VTRLPVAFLLPLTAAIVECWANLILGGSWKSRFGSYWSLVQCWAFTASRFFAIPWARKRRLGFRR